jgi:hypothetical protein
VLWPVKGAAGIRKQGIEGGAVAALAAVQKLRVHVEVILLSAWPTWCWT